MLPAVVERPVSAYLRLADRLLPGRVVGLYVVGSTALGAFRDGRSDIDLVAVLDGPDRPDDARRLRTLHLVRGIATAVSAARRGHSPLSGTCNTTFVRRADLTRPAGEVVPVAAGNGSHFRLGAGPVGVVDWTVFARSGIPVRGPRPDELGLDPQPGALRAWNLRNLESYWRPWAAAYRRGPGGPHRILPGLGTAWAVLGVPRLHCTIATGRIVSKEAAGEYALEAFEARWHPLIRYALAYWRREPRRRSAPPRDLVAAFVEHVVDRAHALP